MRITTDVATDLRRSLQLRGVPTGRTVGDFIDALFTAGARTSDPLGSIEYGCAQGATGRICVERDEHGSLDVREVR